MSTSSNAIESIRASCMRFGLFAGLICIGAGCAFLFLADGGAGTAFEWVAQRFKTTPTTLQIFEYSAAALAILGAELMSRNIRISPWAWVIWVVSSAIFIAFAVMANHWAILAMQCWFMKTNLVGIRTQLLPTLRAELLGSKYIAHMFSRIGLARRSHPS